jgi:hypothetical protein
VARPAGGYEHGNESARARRTYNRALVNRLRQSIAALRARPGVAAIVALGVAWGLTMHSMGWAQLGHYAQLRGFADGQPEIDRWQWETGDKAWIDGHFYSVKSPGVAGLSLPFYLALENTVGPRLSRAATDNARRSDFPRWAPDGPIPIENYGYLRERGERVEAQIEQNGPMIWALTLIVAVIPAVLLLLGVRWAADRLEPGYGTAAAVTLGLATIVMTFASEYFSHVISAALGFGAFMLLMREREGPPSLPLVAGAGLLAGLAVTFEFQVGLVGLILFAYALARSSERLRRAVAYGAGAVCGALPMLAFNLWAFGNPLELAYGSAVDYPGISGHDELGLNTHGFFGITAPRLDSAGELLFASRGLLTLTPIIVMAVVGVVLMRRRGHRAEANTIAAIAIAYFIYNSGYWLPMGGGTPGPRFLVPALPFLAVGLAFAYRRLPALTLGLAIPSAVTMGAAYFTYPLLGTQGAGLWGDMLLDGHLEQTVLTAFGVTNVFLAAAPVLAALATAVVLAWRATPSLAIGDLRAPAAALAAWAAVSMVGPTVADSEHTPLNGDDLSLLWLVVTAAAISLLSLGILRRRELDQSAPAEPAAPERALGPEPALGERSS